MLNSDYNNQSDKQKNLILTSLQKTEFPLQSQTTQHSNLVQYQLGSNNFSFDHQQGSVEQLRENSIEVYKNPPIVSQKLGQKFLFTAEFEINDAPLNIRNILTKGQIQDEIGNFSGTSISTRGRYILPTEKCSNENFSRSDTGISSAIQQQNRPLYLFIQGTSQQSVSSATKKINEIIHKNSNRMNKFTNNNNLILQHTQHFPSLTNNGMAPVPNLLNTNINANQQQQIQAVQALQEQQMSGPFFEKIIVGLDHAPATFNLREQIIGTGGANLAYIQNETGAITQLRGRGSFNIDQNSGLESPEPLHIYLEHQRFEGLQAAKQLAKNLIETLQSELAHFQQINGLATNPVQINHTTIPNGSITNNVQQQHQGQLMTAQVNLSQRPPILAVPPPTIIQPNQIDQQGTTILHQNFVQQNQPPPPPPTLGAPPQTVQSQPTIIHQHIIPQTVPFQLQQNNMVLQQHPQQATILQHPTGTTITNMPPPAISIPLKPGQLIQVQQPPPQLPQLNQPPPNVQLQQGAPGAQIVLNPQQNYQYQYIQQQIPQAGEVHMSGNQQMSIQPMQSIYQPTQQQIQVQPTVLASGNTSQVHQSFDQQQIRQGSTQFHTPVNGGAGQPQYIVQGNTAYMVPQPQTTIIHHQAIATHPGQNSQNIIFQQPHQIQQIPVQQPISIQNMPPPSIISQSNSQFQHLQEQRILQQHTQQRQIQQHQLVEQQSQNSQESGAQSQTDIKEESKNEDNGSLSPSRKTPEEIKSEEPQSNDEINAENANSTTRITTTAANTVTSAPSSVQQNIQLNQISAINMPSGGQLTNTHGSVTTIPHSQAQSSTQVQHLVGNALIASAPTIVTSSANQVLTTQIPVSMQQITQGGQHFVVSAAPQTFHSIQQPIQVQSIMQPGIISNSTGNNQTIQQTFQQIQHPNGIIQNVHISNASNAGHQATAVNINPNNQQAVSLQLQPQQSVQLQLQSVNQIHNMEQPSTQVQIGSHIHLPHQQQFIIQNQNLQQQQVGSIMSIQQQQQPQSQNVVQQFQQQQYKNIPLSDQQVRMIGHKRKFNDDEIGPPNHQARIGVGQQVRMPVTMINLGSQHHQPPPPPPASMTLSQSVQNSNSTDQGGGNKNNVSDEIVNQKNQSDVQQQLQNSQHQQHPQQRQNFYQESFNMDGPPPRPLQRQMISGTMQQHGGPRLPRFHQMMSNNGPGNFQMRSSFRQMPPEIMNNQNHQVGMHPMHRMNFNNGGNGLGPQAIAQQQQQQQQQQLQQYRNDCPPNMNNSGNYGPNPRFRGQW